MEKAIIVCGEGKYSTTALSDLNQHLNNGWKVKMMCPMASSASVAVTGNGSYNKEKYFEPQCLVIIEKN